jgi:hypothetical protein
LLTEPQVTRYSRQILLQEIGGVGQERILTARVALRGAGPAVEAAALYLSAAGVASVVADERAAWVVDGVAAGRAGAGLPCSDCLVAWFAARPRPPPPMIEAAALSAGAMASARILLEIVDPGRAAQPFAVQVYPEAGSVRPGPSPGCPRCRGTIE